MPMQMSPTKQRQASEPIRRHSVATPLQYEGLGNSLAQPILLSGVGGAVLALELYSDLDIQIPSPHRIAPRAT